MNYASLLSVLLSVAPGLVGSNTWNPPDACKLLTLSDVTTVLGAGYVPGPAEARINTSEMSGCLYQRGAGNLVAIAILGAPNGDARAAVLARQDSQKRFGRTVTPLPGVCDAAFTVAISPANTTCARLP
jgi:hypothetical protein